MRKPEAVRLAAAALTALAVVFAWSAVRVRADVSAAPVWRLDGGITTAHLAGNTIYVGGPFTQLYTPSTVQEQFYDLVTGQVLTQCARSTTGTPLTGNPDGRGGLLVAVHDGDAFADGTGAFAPPVDTAIVRVGDDCLWDRQFAAPGIDPLNPSDITIGLPVRVGNVVLASNTVIGPTFFLRAQVAAYDAATGARIAYRYWDTLSEIGFLGVSATKVIARVRGSSAGPYTLGALTPDVTLDLSQTLTFLADEASGVRSWIRGQTLFRLRPSPVNTLEAYDLATLQPKSGWTAPVVPGLTDMEVAGSRVFLAVPSVNGTAVAQPAAVLLTSGARDTSWTPAALTRKVPDPGGNPYVPALTQLATDGVRLYVSGDFELVAGVVRPGVAALSVTGGTLETWDPSPFVVVPLESTKIGLLMSRPTATNLVTRRYLAAIDRTTGVATAWDPNDAARVLLHQPTPVAAIVADATHVYFASATNGEVRRADRVTADVDQNWRLVVSRGSNQPGTVKTMLLVAGTLYLGGEFTSIAGTTIAATPRQALAAVGVDGTLRPWAPALDNLNPVTLFRDMVAVGTTIYLAGEFTTVNAQYRPGFAAVDAVSGALTQPEMFVLGDTSLYSVATDGTQTFVAGVSFGAPLVGATSIPDTQLTRYGPTGGVVPTSAAFTAGRLYAGQEYDVDAGTPTTRTTEWGRVFADALGLAHIAATTGEFEYYEALPGNPPGPPVLTATATGNRIDASWTRAATGGTPSSYTLYAGSAPGLTDIGSAVFRGTSFSITAPTGLYYLTVVARNADGQSAPSNEVAVQAGCLVAPPAPAPLTYTTAGASVSFAWGAAATATGYVAEAGSAPGAANLGSAALGLRTTLSVSAPLGVYYVRVRAVNGCGVSPASNEVAVTLDGTVPAPQRPTGFTAAVTGNVVSLQWTPPSSGGTPADYVVEGGTSPGGVIATAVTTASSLVVPGAPAGTYYLRVRARNAAGQSPASTEAVVTVP